MRLYSNGRYKLWVGTNGEIEVRPNDWLTKYSAAMYNRFWMIHEFGRLHRGRIEQIDNPNLIIAGETLYHIPTYNQERERSGAHSRQPRPPEPLMPAVSEEEKRRLTLETLKHDFHLSGERLELVSEILHQAETLDDAVQLLEICELVAEGTAGAVVGLLNTLLTPVALALALVAAKEEGRKLLGLAGIAYALTAWAFDDAVPGYPERIRKNNATQDPREIARDSEAWKKITLEAVMRQEHEVTKSKKSKKAYQIVFQAMGDFKRITLAQELAESLAEHHVKDVEYRKIVMNLASQYPN